MSVSLLYDAVKARLDDWGTGAVVAFGQVELAKQIGQGSGRANRVVIAPAVDGGGLGTYGPPTKDLREVSGFASPPRSLWTWKVAARVLVWAYEPSAPTDERVQWDALCELHDHVVTAFHTFASGKYSLGQPRDPAGVVERRFGSSVLFVATVDQHVVDIRTVERTGPLVGLGSTQLVGPTSTEETTP